MRLNNRHVLLMGLIICVAHSQQAIAQLKGPIEATVGDSQIKMEYGNNANAPKADEVVINKGNYQPTGMEWIDSQWSWITWWEASKHQYLKPANTKPIDTISKQQAQVALLKVLAQSNDVNLLSAATLALGRMQINEAVPQIKVKLNHESLHVKRAAWLALALIGDEPAIQTFHDAIVQPVEKKSKNATKTNLFQLDFDQASAWIIGIGLMRQTDPVLLNLLGKIALNDQEAVTQATGMTLQPLEALQLARLAMWAIRIHNPPGINQLALRQLKQTVDPFIFNEAIQMLASRPDESLVLNMFTPIYHNRPAQWREVPKALSVVLNQWPGPSVLDQDIAAMRTSVAVAYDHLAIAQNARLAKLAKRNLARSYNDVSLTSRPINRSQPTETIPKRLYKYDNWLNHGSDFDLPAQDTVGYALRFGLIPLGKLGDLDLDRNDEPEDANLLCDILLGSYARGSLSVINPNPTQVVNPLNDPSRGFAAVAMGLYLRRLPADSRNIRNDNLRSQVRYMLRLLRRIAADAEEPSNLRAACLLGLGLSQSQSVNTTIMDVLGQMQSADPLVASFATLALGMLGDSKSFELAKKALEKTADKPDLQRISQTGFNQSYSTAALISQVAIIDGLACMANPKANVLLYPRLMDHPITSERMIHTFKFAGLTDTPVLPSLLKLLENPGKDERVAAFSAWAIGELFDPNPIPVMTEKLLRNRNLTLLEPILLREVTCTCPAKGANDKPITVFRLEQLYLQEVNPLLFKQIIRSPRG